ncbi:DUF4245 domain-containing protein [Solwaraspora sp. WMMD406]|uniref:DUF4245 domain-containing protein n=1 Tax=Solwaraspora sp. WMMD406 TaxID=3016095 RepID=UPI0024170270|nr:DUF4245 domain-containing protein [Solwaraspora sp. WMMD406]MDG4767840.1 DUF4245 domain-containing protein [Solwaraspora sp. WMMD406]
MDAAQTPPGTGSGTGSGPAAEPSAGSRSVRSPKDMTLSLLVLLVPILLVFGAYRISLGADQPVVIDPAPAFAQARAGGGFPVAEPTGLGPDWRPVSATFRPADDADGPTLRVGYITPSGGAVQIVQSGRPAPELLVAELSRTASPQGGEEIAGQSWQWYAARPGERALVRLAPQHSVLVLGRAPDDELRALATALSPPG